MPRQLARIAALAVGEGRAEVVLLNHIKKLYLPRNCGITLKVIEGFGKGGMAVLTRTIRVSKGIAYDRKIALLDTDTDWNDQQRTRALQEEIIVVESTPCLEAWLLAIHGVHPVPSTNAFKVAFAQRFGGPAHDPAVYAKHFTSERLDGARVTVPTLDLLLDSLGVKRPV
jgi:hypothetical protein